jgi:hypothetical protein
VERLKRLVHAFVGLVVGYAILLLFLLQMGIRTRGWALAQHVGEPAAELDAYPLYAFISFVGWLLVALPVAILFPARSFIRLPWPFRVLLGAALGPLALFVMFVVLAHGHIHFPVFRAAGTMCLYSILVSTPAFVVYVALLRTGGRR